MALHGAVRTARRAWLTALTIVLASACSGPSGSERKAPGSTANAAGEAAPASSCTSTGAAGASECAPAESVCQQQVPHYANGRVVAQVCPAQATQAGLTVIDLRDDWAPRILAGAADEPLSYRDTYVKLANEKLGEGEAWYRAESDRYYELYGVFPSLAVVSSRLQDDKRHECHDAVADEALGVLDEAVDTWQPVIEQRSDMGYAKMLEGKLASAARQKALPSIDALADDPEWADTYTNYRRLETRKRAIREMQAHLRCEGLLKPGHLDGLLDSATVAAMQTYHRRHMIVSWQLDNETRQALLTDSRELDFRTQLRVLRERIVDAAGVIEDGSAREEPHPVVGRFLDARAFVFDDRGDRTSAQGEQDSPAQPAPRAPEGAPDWIGQATDVAAQALGWWAPPQGRAFLEQEPRPERVAVQLPARPDYHSPHMALSAEIDRGDVWYDYPFVPNGDRRVQPRARKPTMTLYAEHGGKRIALARWPTTIGGWQPEVLGQGGSVKLAYKESLPGKRLWRDVVALPRWIPPSSTPRRDLWRPRRHGRWGLKVDTFGPGYASAYGMVMMIHHREDQDADGSTLMTDYGVRSHGSVSYSSILDGFSHGCHRLHNHRAVRLAGFLLDHRKHEVRGPMELDYYRTFRWRRLQRTVHFDSRGYRYELTPPVPVEVLEGRIRGLAQSALPPRPLTRPMWKRYTR